MTTITITLYPPRPTADPLAGLGLPGGHATESRQEVRIEPESAATAELMLYAAEVAGRLSRALHHPCPLWTRAEARLELAHEETAGDPFPGPPDEGWDPGEIDEPYD